MDAPESFSILPSHGVGAAQAELGETAGRIPAHRPDSVRSVPHGLRNFGYSARSKLFKVLLPPGLESRGVLISIQFIYQEQSLF